MGFTKENKVSINFLRENKHYLAIAFPDRFFAKHQSLSGLFTDLFESYATITLGVQ